MADTHRRTASGSRLTPEEITNRGFASAFRGVSETEVRNFLRRVADDLAAMKAREADLSAQIDDLQKRIANPPPVTEQQLLDALGEETARVLRSAQDAAEEIRRRAEEKAAEVVREAQETAEQLRSDAEQQATARGEVAERQATEVREAAEARATEQREQAEREVTELRETANREVEELREQAQRDAASQVEAANVESHALVDEARTVRERLLADLARRRSLLQAQVDELRSGRDRLLDAYRVVKHTLGDATDALAQVEARANAELAGPAPRVALPPVEGEFEMLADADEAASRAEGGVGIDLDETVVVVEEGAGEAPAAVESADSGAAVDALFARLRASHTGDPGSGPEPAGAVATEEAAAEESPAEPAAEADPVAPEPPVETADGASEPAPTEAEVEAEAEPAADDSIASEKAPTAAPAEGAPADEEPVGDDALRVRRDEQLGPITRDLTRRTKRTLQDEHNEVLDKIRTVKGRVESATVVPDLDTMRAAWTEAVAEPLGAAYTAGVVAMAGSSAAKRTIPPELVGEVAVAMVDPWRERLVAAIDAAGDDTDAVTQRIGSRYREYRGGELDRLLGDAIAAAWARGSFDAAPAGARLRWVPAEVGRCADCDDNALEPTARTEPFPTGQLHPPAHPGCRCFLALAEPVASGT